MNYFLSMDGGGTKTKWLLTDISGHSVDTLLSDGCSHPQIGAEGVCQNIKHSVSLLLKRNHIALSQTVGVCLGIPCFGEYPCIDSLILTELESFFQDINIIVCNDVELGFWGALPSGRGIHIVAGTGAAAYGRNDNSHSLQTKIKTPGEFSSARSNGWHYLLSDEGSGYWLGLKALSIYLKEEDGRLEHGALREIFKRELHISSALELAAYYDNNLHGKRKEIAALQKFLSEAAEQGDSAALEAYASAVHELSLSVFAIQNRIFPSGSRIPVSYSGGIFQNKKFVLFPLKEKLEDRGLLLTRPLLSPEVGGIWMIAQKAGYAAIDFLNTLADAADSA